MDNLFLNVKKIFNWNFHSISSSTVKPFVAKYLTKERGDLNEVALDNDNDKDDDDDNEDDGNSKDVEVVEIGTVKH